MNNPKNWQSGQVIALVCIVTSAVMSGWVFFLARGDHDMKLLAIGGVLGFVSGTSATASTLLVGKPTVPDKHDPTDLPAGSVTTSTETTQTPPITITPDTSANPTT